MSRIDDEIAQGEQEELRRRYDRLNISHGNAVRLLMDLAVIHCFYMADPCPCPHKFKHNSCKTGSLIRQYLQNKENL